MGRVNSYCEIQGEEWEVDVDVEHQPAEPDVNVGAGIEVTGIWRAGVEVSELLTGPEFEALEMRMADSYHSSADDYGDYLYDQRKDREMERD